LFDECNKCCSDKLNYAFLIGISAKKILVNKNKRYHNRTMERNKLKMVLPEPKVESAGDN